jgi:hypothetical protein
LKSLAQPLASDRELTSILGLAPLLKQAFYGVDLAPFANQFIERAKNSPDANALMDLSTVLQLRGERELALKIQADALSIAQLYRIASNADGDALKLLILKAPGDLQANTPLECILENANFSVEILYVSPDLPLPNEFPEHDILFVAIGESNDNRPILKQLRASLSSWPRPCLNAPGQILQLARDMASKVLNSIPSIVMPSTVRIDRHTLQQVALGETSIRAVLGDGDLPVILRPVDSHAGDNLIKAENIAEVSAFLANRPESEFFISRFVDYSSTDGLFRKYRIVMIEGRPFLCHMGISNYWMVHYPYDEMIPNAERRSEEERAMASFDQDFALRHQVALRAIHERFGLEYIGLDCAESTSGELVIFEVASAMVIHAIDRPDIFPYKQPQMKKVFAAFHEMLLRTAQRTGEPGEIPATVL